MPDQKELEKLKTVEIPIPEKPEGHVVGEEHSIEAESVIEKIERQKKAGGDVRDDTTVVPASSGQPAVTLPVTQDDVKSAKKIPIISSLAWLVAWAVRQMKKLGGRAGYRKPEVGEEGGEDGGA